jgi:hypothetical protein
MYICISIYREIYYIYTRTRAGAGPDGFERLSVLRRRCTGDAVRQRLRPNVSLLRAPHSVHVRRARVRPRRHSSVRRALSPEGNEAETLSSAQTESPMQHNQTHTTSHTSTSTSTRAFVCFGLLLGFRERCVPTTMRRFQ